MLVLDIETRGDKRLEHLLEIKAQSNLKDEEKIKASIEKKKSEQSKTMAVDTDLNEIICIGIKEDDNPAKLVSIEELGELIRKHDRIITFKGKSFDIPTIIKKGLKQRIKLPYEKLKRLCEKFERNHADLMLIIGEYGKYKSLDFYLQVYLGIKKKEIDFSTATEKEIKAHCIEDCDNTYKLYELFEPICW